MLWETIPNLKCNCFGTMRLKMLLKLIVLAILPQSHKIRDVCTDLATSAWSCSRLPSQFYQTVTVVPGCRSLCSACRGDLLVPCVLTKTFGYRSFTYLGPSAWNALPIALLDSLLSLPCFKSKLKTRLFHSS